MPSGLFGIGRSALLVQQRALQVVSQNIANAETPGYSRQQAQLVASMPVRFPWGSVGTGVMIDDIARMRDALRDEAFREVEGQLSGADTRRGLLEGIEAIFGEPGDRGLSASLDRFWSAWGDLASDPTSGAARAVVQQRGRELATLVSGYDRQLTNVREQALTRTQNAVTEVNELARQVAELNGRIRSAEAGDRTAGDLRDMRDTAIDRLAALIGARAVPNEDGTIAVVAGTATLVDNTTARELVVELDPPPAPPAVVPADLPVRVRMGSSPDALRGLGGEIGAMLGVVNTDIPDLRGRLDALAVGLTTEVNTLHSTGYTFPTGTPPGTLAGNFFRPGAPGTPVRASTFALDPAIEADARAIAVSGDPQAQTDNAVATALAALRDRADTVSYTGPSGTEQGSFLGFFRSTMTRWGVETRRASDDTEAFRALATQAESRRQEISGVNLDEELISMMRFQQAYAAAAKLITTADEMLQTVLGLKG